MPESEICGNKVYGTAQQPDQKDFILQLRDVSRADRLRVGTKAANLGELAKAGFPVPAGFIVTTSAFHYFLTVNSLSSGSSAEAMAAAYLTKKVADTLSAAAAQLGDIALAVRSSAVAEDLPGASFAGQYLTVLGVRGSKALVDAVNRCLASTFSERAAGYRKVIGQQGIPSMAVLVQSLIPAYAAGVAFTANPLTGDRSETLVSAVRGLGDRLVSGETTPDEWRVKGNDIICERAPEAAIDAGQVLDIASHARRVEAYFGCPQDIEWAICDGRLFLLQARPITALPEPPAAAPTPQ